MQFNMVLLKEIFHLAEKGAPVIFIENMSSCKCAFMSCIMFA